MRSEDVEQEAVIAWAHMEERYLPDLKMLYHVPNERKCTVQQGAKLKRLGVRAGVPDLILDVARGNYHGLRIEMKAMGGRATPAQKEWLDQLRLQGYAATICYGAEAAIKVLKDYLEKGIV